MIDPTAADLMALTPAEARTVFRGDAAAVATRFRALARRWHPDANPAPDAAAVFAQLTMLHGVAYRALVPAERRLTTIGGRTFRLAYRARRATNVGETLIGDRVIAHLVPAALDELADRAAAFAPRFADERMRLAMARHLPRPLATMETRDGYAFVERKPADAVLLRDLLTLGPVSPTQAAWMTTRLVNIAAWLQWAGIAHGAIGPDTVLVSPADHGLSLTGPFLTAGSFGTLPRTLPERTLALAPRYASEALDDRLDPELVRLTVREALGDAAGTRLLSDPGFPRPFAQWLLLPTVEGARTDFPAWERAREASFGPRRFVPWHVDTAALLAA